LKAVSNAITERWVGTVRRECLDWLLITGERHLRQVLHEYAAYYHVARPHRSLGLWPPLVHPSSQVRCHGCDGAVYRHDRLSGLLHEYQRAAA